MVVVVMTVLEIVVVERCRSTDRVDEGEGGGGGQWWTLVTSFWTYDQLTRVDRTHAKETHEHSGPLELTRVLSIRGSLVFAFRDLD